MDLSRKNLKIAIFLAESVDLADSHVLCQNWAIFGEKKVIAKFFFVIAKFFFWPILKAET